MFKGLNRLRPVKDLFFEEYWNIGFRRYSENDSVITNTGGTDFDVLKATKRFWYADPFLFEHENRTYLFVEMFDNKTEIGIIGCSEYVDGKFTQPVPVLQESFHLSYPYVFEKDGEIFMMPETHEDNCIQLYKAVNFPDKWEKHHVIVKGENFVDTVIFKDMLLTSKVTDPVNMVTRLELYDFNSGEQLSPFPASEENQLKRGAGQIFESNGKAIRPAQNCENAFYGGGIIFYEIEDSADGKYSEKEIGRITPKNISTSNGLEYTGTHTYARTSSLEVVDIKRSRINIRRLLWILKKKI